MPAIDVAGAAFAAAAAAAANVADAADADAAVGTGFGEEAWGGECVLLMWD